MKYDASVVHVWWRQLFIMKTWVTYTCEEVERLQSYWPQQSPAEVRSRPTLCNEVIIAVNSLIIREKGRDLTQSCDKNPYTHRIIQKATWQHKNATKNLDYTTIADRLRTVSWSNSSHPTGVVKALFAVYLLNTLNHIIYIFFSHFFFDKCVLNATIISRLIRSSHLFTLISASFLISPKNKTIEPLQLNTLYRWMDW